MCSPPMYTLMNNNEHPKTYNHIYINSLRLSVCDGGFEGWGKGEAGEAAGDLWRPVSVCDKMWFSCYDASAGFVILQSDFCMCFCGAIWSLLRTTMAS